MNRPNFHQKDSRVQRYFVLTGLMLDRALEKKLKSAGLDLSSKEAWQILKTVRVVEIELGPGEQKRSVTQGTERAAWILRALGINNLDPDVSARSGKDAA